MSWVTWAAIYFTVWWVVLFAVLPLGVRRSETPAPGHEPGAPAQPRLKWKFLLTSLISAALVLAGWALFATGLLDWQALMRPD
ncbi:DUF1467 family protein [Oleisolibacter albus]|uniref:DUF1467 family protein n=1 Tax=Oleisolibacter albus TaxID=2171757 RepID=UPI000DF22978|nr:DUF1467 family protein [Oleisolibacter albus]